MVPNTLSSNMKNLLTPTHRPYSKLHVRGLVFLMDPLDWTAERKEMCWWGHLEGQCGSNLQLHPPPLPSAPPLPPSLAAAAKPLEERKEGGEEGLWGFGHSQQWGGLKHICATERPKPFPWWINGRIMHLIISIWRIRHWKGEQGWGAGCMLKPQAVSTRVSIMLTQDRALYYTEDTSPSFHEDCLHSSGQNTLLDIIYDLQGWLWSLKSVKCPDVAVTIEWEEGISC